MTGKVLILGGYGNFGKRIAQQLLKSDISVILCGRNQEKAEKLAQHLNQSRLKILCGIAIFDVKEQLAENLKTLKPVVVINTCGPFQGNNYDVAKTCIKMGVHYIDIADGRDFVCGITNLDSLAKEKNVNVISGASTVPGLSSAVVEHYKSKFSQINSMIFGISPGQKADRGLATTQGILSYVGRALKSFPNEKKVRFGWQDIYRQSYPGLNKRWMANCEIPDLDLLPKIYGIKNIQFSAGVELWPLHLGLWALSWLVRIGLPLNLPKLAGPLLKISNMFDLFGSADGGMHVILKGLDGEGRPLIKKWFIIAKSGHGPFIPCIPAIHIAKQIVTGHLLVAGARPCVGLITLEGYLKELAEFDVKQHEIIE